MEEADMSVPFFSKGDKVTAKAHGGPIDIEGVTIARVDDQLRLQAVDTWFDSLQMFRQIAPEGVVKKEAKTDNRGPEARFDEAVAQDAKLSPEDISKLHSDVVNGQEDVL
ncbi:hypothetical protein ColKHC_09449 [Colletotrichum higginsianum]|nr:hypothetical protein ColKHC_09449 [Colletotrichum higginsianum]